MLIDIGYAIRGLNDPRNLVFPFYVIPDEGEPGRHAIGQPVNGQLETGRPAYDAIALPSSTFGLIGGN